MGKCLKFYVHSHHLTWSTSPQMFYIIYITLKFLICSKLSDDRIST